MRKETIEIDVDAQKGVDGIDDLTQSVDSLTGSIDNLGVQTTESLDKIDKNSKKTQKSVEGIGKGFKGVGLAIKALGIGLVLKAFDLLGDILSQNQGFLNFTSTAFNVLSIAFRDFTEFIFKNFGKVTEFIQKAFSLQGLKDFGTAIKENIIERFNSAIKVAGFLGDTFKALFTGDFALAAQFAKEAAKEFVDVITGVDGSFEKGKDLINDITDAIVDYTTETIKAASATTDLKNQSLLAAAVNRGLIEQYDRQAEQLRQIRDDDLRNIEERIEANKALGKILDEQEKIMLANADIIIAAAQSELNLNNTIENQVALIDARNERLGVLAQIEGFRSEQLVNTNALLREQQDIELERIKELSDAEDIRTQKEREAAAARIKIAELEFQNKMKLLSATSKAIQAAGDILGKETSAGKALAVASSLINTYTGIAASLKIGGFVGIAQAIATGLVGFKAVKDIIAVPVPGETGVGQVPQVQQVQAPQFNVVGTTGVNQLATSISQQTQQPIKAFVVAKDVTTQQELDRNTVSTATFGN